jgi:hypothetical protein
MSPAARSILVYSFYMLFMGQALFWVPDLLLAAFGLPAAGDIWIRMLGLMVFCAGMLYFYCGRAGQTGFFRISVPERLAFFLGTLVLVLFFGADWRLALVGSVDLFGALWTYLALRARPV